MVEGVLFHFTKPDPNWPIEKKYVKKIDGKRKSFIHQNDAMLHLFDNGVRKFRRLTKEIREYKNISNLPVYQFWHIENRVGYVLYDYEPYIDDQDNFKKRRAFVWRFVGFGRSCFAKTKKKLAEKVRDLIHEYNNKPAELGYNTYPYFTRYYREGLKTN